MVTYQDLAAKLIEIGREDAVEALSQLYQDGHERLKWRVDEGHTGEKYSHLLMDGVHWSETPQGSEYWVIVHNQLRREVDDV